MLMPKKKKSDNWKHDCPKIKIKKGDITGTIYCCPKKKRQKEGQRCCPMKREERKKNAT